jgi:hypothetical protein
MNGNQKYWIEGAPLLIDQLSVNSGLKYWIEGAPGPLEPTAGSANATGSGLIKSILLIRRSLVG